MAVIANLTVKLQAQIAEFQSEFREATKSAEKFQSEFSGIAIKASAIGNIIADGVRFAVTGLKNLASSVLENASTITDLSQKTGLAMRTIQEFQHVAEQTGTSVEAFTNAAFKLGANLAGDDKSVSHAVERLGLSFSQLKQLSPDEQFNRIAAALSEMENPQERNRIALELFGKTAKDILPAITEGYRKMADGATIAGDDQIKALDAAGDAWARFKTRSLTEATQAAGSIVLVGEKAASSKKSLVEFLGTMAISGGVGNAFAITAANMKSIADDAERMAKAVKNAPKIGEIAFGKPGTGSQRPNQFGIGIDVDKELKQLIKAQEEAQRAAEAHAKAIKALADSLSGAELQRQAKDLAEAFRSLGAQRNAPVVIQNTADAALKLFNAGAKLTPELFNVVIESGKLTSLLPEVKTGFDGAALGIHDVTGELEAANDTLIDFIDSLNSIKFTQGLDNLKLPGFDFKSTIPEPLPPTFWDSVFDVKGPSLAQSARFAADSVIGSLSDAIRNGNWAQFKAALRDAFSQFAGSAIAAGINLLIPGLGTLLQPLFAALTSKLIGLFDRNKGRDLVEAFAEGFGGFDALHKELNLLGDEGEELWKTLTQGVGRNNPDQAAKAIAEVEAAIAKYRSEQQSANITTEEGAQATIESAAAAALALDQVNERLLVNSAAWGDWSALVTGYLQKLADDIRALPLPGPTGTMGGSTGGARPRLSIGGSTGGNSVSIPVGSMPSPENGSTTVILEMDSYALAEAVVPQIPGVVQRYGLADV